MQIVCTLKKWTRFRVKSYNKKRGVHNEKTEYIEGFRQSIVNLYRSGKPSSEILKEYRMSSSGLYKWIKKYSIVQISETESMTMVEIKGMQKHLALLEEENMILKKPYLSSPRSKGKS